MIGKKSFNITAISLVVLMLMVVGIMSFFIVYNAEWLIGDDMIIMNRTGWGTPFTIWDTIKPEIGRFFPLAYMHENIVLLLPNNMHSASQHYLVNLLLFLVLIITLIKTSWCVCPLPHTTIKLFILFFTVIMCATRLYSLYLNVFSTLYNYCTLTSIHVLSIVMYYEKKKIIYAIYAILCTIYMIFCIECAFVIPLALSMTTLLFCRKHLSKQQISFNVILVLVVFIFLLIYFIGIYLKSDIDFFYDPSHGSDVTFIENLLSILKGQKFLLFVVLLWIARQTILICKKDKYHILYDSLLWTVIAILVGNLILKLDWQMYYYNAILYAIPPVLYFGCKRVGDVFVLMIILLFAGLHTLKVPIYIEKNQINRKNTLKEIKNLSDQIDNGKDIVWYETNVTDSSSYDLILREWEKDCMLSYIRFYRKDSNWNFAEYMPNKECVMLYPIKNDSFADRPLWLPKLTKAMISDILIYDIYPDSIK